MVDEGSLVSVEILSRALQYLFYHARLTKLVILGKYKIVAGKKGKFETTAAFQLNQICERAVFHGIFYESW